MLHFLQNIHFPLKCLLENGLQEDLLLVNDLDGNFLLRALVDSELHNAKLPP